MNHTNQVNDVCLSPHAQIPPLWLTQVKHIHEITKFSNQPSILFHLVLICRNTRLHLFHSLFWTHTTFNLLVLFKETYIYGGDEFQYTAWFQGHCVCWQTFESFFSFILNSESLQSENEEKNFIIYPCIKILFVIYDVLMVFKVDLIITGISSNKWSPSCPLSPFPHCEIIEWQQ